MNALLNRIGVAIYERFVKQKPMTGNRYGVEGMYQEPNDPQREQNSEEQFGTIPGPFFPVFNGTMGLSWMRSPLGYVFPASVRA